MLAMALPQIASSISPEEYLRLERAAEFKSEYFAGEIFSMAGATAVHCLITANVIGELRNLLKGKKCRVYDSNLRVLVPATGLYTYPDAVVVCGPLEYAEADVQRETITNPTLLVEVLSDSTEAYNRGRKFEHFRSIASCSEYVLISQSAPLVEVYLRQADGKWELTPVTGLDASVALRSIGGELRLAEVYDGVEFPPVPPLHVERAAGA